MTELMKLTGIENGRGKCSEVSTAVTAGVGILFSKAFNPVSVRTEHVIQKSFSQGCFDHLAVVFMNIYAPTNREELLKQENKKQ